MPLLSFHQVTVNSDSCLQQEDFNESGIKDVKTEFSFSKVSAMIIGSMGRSYSLQVVIAGGQLSAARSSGSIHY